MASATPITGVFCRQEMDGGARAWACQPAREPSRSGAASSHTTRCGLSQRRCEGRFGRSRGTRLHAPRSTSRRHRHGRDARRFDRSGRSPKRHRLSRSAPHGGDRRRRCWPPSRHRSVQGLAPRGPSGRWEEISTTAGASKTTSSTQPTNHAGSPELRSSSDNNALQIIGPRMQSLFDAEQGRCRQGKMHGRLPQLHCRRDCLPVDIRRRGAIGLAGASPPPYSLQLQTLRRLFRFAE